MVVTLTYEDLNRIALALVHVQNEEQQLRHGPCERVFTKIVVTMLEVEDIEPKPKFKLTREGE